MDYNTTGTETRSGVSNSALVFAIILLLLCAGAFAFFYFFYVVKDSSAPGAQRALTQEDIDAIISQEPKSNDDTITYEGEFTDLVLDAETRSESRGSALTDEELLKIQQAN